MNEKPSLFNTEMVRPILTGQKTQTRRIVKLPSWSTSDWDDFELHGEGMAQPHIICTNTGCLAEIPSPYGQSGDLLWVRETWRTDQGFDDVKPRDLPRDALIQYKADGTILGTRMGPFGKWRPSIFMPRWASRITLRVLSIRVEQIQQISEEDCFAEGAIPPKLITSPIDPIGLFRELWNSINAKRGYGWDDNPCVWVVKFERIDHAK
jgi:hypothetical protein